MPKNRVSHTKRIAAIIAAAVISFIGPLFSLNAFADGDINVTFNNWKSYDISSNTVTWSVDNTDVSLAMSDTVLYDDQYNVLHMMYSDHSALYNIAATYTDSTFCDNYEARLNGPNNYGATLVCNGTSLSIPDNTNIPDSSDFGFEVRSKNQQQPATDHRELSFDNVKSYDENNQAYVIVTSLDQSLAGKEFKITAQNTIIGVRGGENGTQYTSEAQDINTFQGYSYRIQGEGFEFDPDIMQVTVRGPEGYEERLALTRVGEAWEFNLANVPFSVSLSVDEFHDNTHHEDERPPHPGVPTNGKVTVTDAGASNNPKSFYLGRVEINQTPIFDNEECEWNSDNCPDTYVNDNLVYNKEENVNTVEITFSSLFIYKYVGQITINGHAYDIPVDYSNRQSWLAHYGYQCVSFTFDDVPYAAEYVISYSVAQAEGHEQYVGNFLWSTDPREEFDDQGRPSDIYIGHAHLELVEVLCHITENDDEDIRFNVEKGEEVPAGCVFEYSPDDENNPVGSLVVPEGSEVTVRLKTDYGYQVTSFGSNGSEIKVDEGKIAQYTFGIFRGNFHLGAIVEATDDEVNIDTDSVKSGTITLGGDEIDEGTAMLTIEDVKLSDEEKAQFMDEAGDYDVKTYLNIDLDQIFYDGHGGFWKGATMRELENEATVTLKLSEDIDGDQIVLVHQKHDGTYEIIPTEYDPKTHTITFKTSSFSNYAIATKTATVVPTDDAEETAEDVEAPKTFDSIVYYLAMLTLCGFSLAAVGIVGLKAVKKN